MTRKYTGSKRSILLKRKKIVEDWLELKSQGVNEYTLQRVFKISRATFYRWNKGFKSHGLYGLMPKSKRPFHVRQPFVLTNSILAKIRAIREQYPLYGKVKIHALCVKQGISVSQASVGRALHYFINRGIITPVPILKCSKIRKSIRKFTNSYSQRLPKHYKTPIQLDHTIINLRGSEHRVFVGYDRLSKYTVFKTYKQANSNNASDFLQYLIKHWPYKPTELQVDGGSEFRAYFEESCKTNNIKLFVLPPRSPKLNAGVERFNQTLQDEYFLQNYNELPTEVDLLNNKLFEWQKYYNEDRPHRSLLDNSGLPMSPVSFLKSHML